MPTDDTTISLSISQHFRGKENVAPLRNGSNQWAFGAFDNVTLTPTALALHVTDGSAFCVAALKRDPANPSKMRTEAYNFLSSELVGLDFDGGPDVTTLLRDDFVGEYAFLVYPTASSTPAAPRSRALFRLTQTITDTVTYRDLMARLLNHFKLTDEVDKLKDAVRIFYGSDQKGAEIRPMSLLPVGILQSLPLPPVTRQPARQTVSTEGDHTEMLNALNCIPPDGIPYTDWIKVLAALHYELGASDGLRAAKQWTGHSSKKDELQDKFDSFDGASSPVTAGTIFHLARQFNYQPPRHEPMGMMHHAPDIRQASEMTPATKMVEPPKVVTWHTSDQSMDRFKERLVTPGDPRYRPLPFPFEVLKESEGLCWAIPVGLMVGIVGASGGAKTSFVETLVERWRQIDANHTLWWGPEWNWELMADRSSQRLGGPRADQMMLHEIALAEREGHVPPEKRFGRMLSAQVVEQAGRIADEVKSWPGKNHYIDQMDLDIDDLITEAEKKVAEQELAGSPLRIAVFDYVQLMNMRSARSEAERITQVLGRIKGFCVDNHLVGIVVSQVTKQNSASMRDGIDTLDAESGQFQRSDKFNLVLTLNPVYEDGKFAGRAVLRVAKNSWGKPLQKTVPVDMSRLVWVDKELPPDKEPIRVAK